MDPSGIEALLSGALVDLRDRRLKDASTKLSQAGHALDAARIPPDDPRRGEHATLRGHVLRLLGDGAAATALLEQVVARAPTAGWFGSGSRAAIQLAWLLRASGNTTGAERAMRDAVRLAERAGPDAIVTAQCGLANLLSLHGDRSGSERALAVATEQAINEERFRVEMTRAHLSDRHGRPEEAERALRLAAKLAPSDSGRYEVAQSYAKLALGRGKDAVALRQARIAAKLASTWGSSLVAAGAKMLLGEVARSLGKHDEADRAYRAAELDYGNQLAGRVARLNRAMNEVARGNAQEAAEIVAPMRQTFSGNPVAEAVVLLCAIPAWAAVGEWGTVGDSLSEVSGRISASGVVHRDIAWLAQLGADLCQEHQQHELAIRFVSLAHDQWRRLGNSDRLSTTTTALRVLRGAGGPIPLRGFLLDGVLGEGASGTVWRGRHAASGELVAIKVLRGGPNITPTVRSMFARELRAVAGLDHPNVVFLLDHGWVDECAALADPRLELDAPYLALEFAPHGTLDAWCARMPWHICLPVLLCMLDALSHAHARGLLHLDLKPANVLLSGTLDVPVPKLADFGLARAPAPGRQLRATGTPAYMAPEQFGTDAGALGPWTDLYALGCVIMALFSGAPPFGLRGSAHLRDAHLNHRPPDLKPVVDVPSGLVAIVARLLAKSPSDRFRSAADVAHALAQLGPADMFAGTIPDVPLMAKPTEDLAAHGPLPEPWRQGAGSSQAPSHTPARPRGLLAAGLGLVSLRRPRTVGRDEERSQLWNALRRVVERGQGETIVIAGEPGHGARHLVRWLAERGHELGATRGMLLRAQEGLPQAFRGDEAKVVAELERWSSARPLVLGLLGADRISDAERVMMAVRKANKPVLCLATLTMPLSHDAWTRFQRMGPMMTLGPVPDEHLRILVASLLPLLPDLTEPICVRAQGSPGAVVRMVRRLAEERQLVPLRGGWVLRPSADLDDVLGQPLRSQRDLAMLPDESRAALTVLAAAGGHATTDVFERGCQDRGVANPGAALERLVRLGWIDPEPSGLRLAEGVADALTGDVAGR